MRRRLTAFFSRKRVRSPDDLADEALNRVARRLEEEAAITDTPPARYCFIVAKFVFLEHLRRPDAHSHDGLEPVGLSRPDDEAERERRLDCLDRCLGELGADDRSLILDYYRGDDAAKIAARRALAERLGLSANALTIRACRLRHKLEACVVRRMGVK